MRLMQKPMQLQNASTQANATKATMQVPMSMSANAMRLLQNPMQLQNASAKANATKTTHARINISANAIRLMQKPMQLQIQKN